MARPLREFHWVVLPCKTCTQTRGFVLVEVKVAHTFLVWPSSRSMDYLQAVSWFAFRYSIRGIPFQKDWPFKTTSPHFNSLCSFPPRRPKCIQLLNQSVLMRVFGELKPISFRSKRMSLSSGVRLDASFGLFPFPSRFKCFCFDLSASLVLAKFCPVITDSL